MISFQNKTVLVTGGSRGIGAATAQLFAKLGANIAFNYSHQKNSAENVYQNIKKHSVNCFFQQCNIADPKQIKSFVDQAIATLGNIDILVNNAGIWEYAEIDKMTITEWQNMMRINLDSVFYFTKLVVAHMKAKKNKGHIINIASTAGQRGEAFHSHYAASKGAIISFTKSLATELGPLGINVNCVAPGWVDTDMAHKAILSEKDKILDQMSLLKIPQASDIAGPIVFLASDWASAITGEILNVNSGSVLCG